MNRLVLQQDFRRPVAGPSRRVVPEWRNPGATPPHRPRHPTKEAVKAPTTAVELTAHWIDDSPRAHKNRSSSRKERRAATQVRSLAQCDGGVDCETCESSACAEHRPWVNPGKRERIGASDGLWRENLRCSKIDFKRRRHTTNGRLFTSRLRVFMTQRLDDTAIS